MRSASDIISDLDRVRQERREMFPTQSAPLSQSSPEPAGYEADAPGGEITELLATEARLVLELDGVRLAGRADGADTGDTVDTGDTADMTAKAPFPDAEEVRAARCIVDTIEQRSADGPKR